MRNGGYRGLVLAIILAPADSQPVLDVCRIEPLDVTPVEDVVGAPRFAGRIDLSPRSQFLNGRRESLPKILDALEVIHQRVFSQGHRVIQIGQRPGNLAGEFKLGLYAQQLGSWDVLARSWEFSGTKPLAQGYPPTM